MTDLVGSFMNQGIDNRSKNFSIRIMRRVKQDGPREAVVASNQKRGSSIQQAIVPGIDAAPGIDVANLPTRSIINGFGLSIDVKPGIARRAGKYFGDRLGGEDLRMVRLIERGCKTHQINR